MQELQEFPDLEVFTIKDPTYHQDKIASSSLLKTMVKKPDGRALRVYHVA
jgi:hypothetical protein